MLAQAAAASASPAAPSLSKGRGWVRPPHPLRADGQERQVGLEGEVGAIGIEDAARAVEQSLGGKTRWISEFARVIEGGALGEVLVELDFRHAKTQQAERPWWTALVRAGQPLIPVEVVCPPVPLSRAHHLEALRLALRHAGARGTFANPFYALALQLNPELPRLDVGTILDTLRAFILLRPWLRAAVAPDLARRILGFAAPFPPDYLRLILHPDYAPEMAGFTEDYLHHNPTRNREVDVLPLLAHVQPARVQRALPQESISPRPTWHYRLPNMDLDNADWHLGLEWSRWVRVEALAAQPAALAHFGRQISAEPDDRVLARSIAQAALASL